MHGVAIRNHGGKVVVSMAALTQGKGCLSCHKPHAAPQKKLLIAKDSELCYTCHAKTKEGKKGNMFTSPSAPGSAAIAITPMARISPECSR